MMTPECQALVDAVLKFAEDYAYAQDDWVLGGPECESALNALVLQAQAIKGL